MRRLLFTAALAVCGLVSRAQFDPGDMFIGETIAPEMDAVYVRGIQFLKATQSADGSWPGTHGTEPGVVGLSVLSILAHGEDPNHGPYAQTIRRGIDFILKNQGPNGYIGRSMYNHGFASLALAESYGSLDDARIGPALKKAVNLIMTSQSANPHGGWRYSPESTDADSTVSGAQMVALFAARNAGLEIPDKAIKRGLAYFKSCQTPDGGIGYTGPGGPNSARTAIGALAFALAREKDDPAFQSAFKYLKQSGFDPDGSYPMYYEYYAAQAFFHGDMEVWKKWNASNFQSLRDAQDESGGWQGGNGPAFSTAAALLSLAVNYRLVPIYER